MSSLLFLHVAGQLDPALKRDTAYRQNWLLSLCLELRSRDGVIGTELVACRRRIKLRLAEVLCFQTQIKILD